MRNTPQPPDTPQAATRFVKSDVIARTYSLTSRYVLQLAAEGKIPSLRLAAKAVRFSEADVAEAMAKLKSP